MLYEIGFIENGEIIRGGYKAPLLTVGKWIRENMKLDPNTVYVAVPANGSAIPYAEGGLA